MSDTSLVPGENYPPAVADEPLRIIIISPDGTVVAYDNTGTIIEDDYENAYSLWLSENRALDKPFDFYTVSEGLLLLIAIVSVVSFFGRLFFRRRFKL